MHVVYIAGCYSNKTYEWCRKEYPKLPNLPGQKFHKLLVCGLIDCDVKVDVISHLPMKYKALKQHKIQLPREKENGVTFYYLRSIRSRLNNFSQFFEYKNLIKQIYKKDDNVVVICDVLRPSSVIPVQQICRKLNIKCYGIATDIPTKRAEKGSFRTQMANKIAKLALDTFDGYIFLTQAMNDLVNGKNKPYVVTECLVDKGMITQTNSLEKKHDSKVCLYAGAIRKVYGIDILVEGFLKANVENSELHIYGSGDYSDELKKICSIHDNIKFYGVMPNEYIVSEELKATLLINPRPAEGEYTKFSFPSKNMEYMVSGTPLLGVRLPGIPTEYFDYMYTIDKVTSDEIADKLKELLLMPCVELHNKGMQAREFVLENKNNSAQAEKIVNMILSK